jgi:hypothetical protein
VIRQRDDRTRTSNQLRRKEKEERPMNAIVHLIPLFVLALAGAQAPNPDNAEHPAITGEEILERYVVALGGREVLDRITTYALEATIEMPGRAIRGTLEIAGKAPDRMLVVRTIDKVGAFKQGFDGTSGWSEDPYNGLRRLDGEELEIVRRSAVFNADLKWRQLYDRVESLGLEKLGGRDVHVVRLTGEDSPSETRYYDAATFLLVRSAVVYEGPQGKIPIETRYDDYRVVDGAKVAHQWTQTTPAGEMVVRVTRVRQNPAIGDAVFKIPAR